MMTPFVKEVPRRGKHAPVERKRTLRVKPIGLPSFVRSGSRTIRMVVGVTSDQTCLVLTGRLRALRLAGFDVTLVASPGDLLDRTGIMEGVATWPVHMNRGISLLADLRSLFLLGWVLMRVQPLMTDFSTPKAGLLGNLAAWMMRVPHRVYTLRGLKLESSKGFKLKVLLFTERLAAACAHIVLCNSESLRDAAVTLRIAHPDKLHVLGNGSSNGVDTTRFCPGPSSVRGRLGIDITEPVIGFVGRLTNDKGIPELLQAFDSILLFQPRCWLVLVGWFDMAEDRLDERWRRHLEAHPRIRHVGYVDDTASYYRAMDLLVLPTHREGFPNVALEAAACGLPVITTETTGARDAVISEVTGLLIQPGYPEGIAEACLELLGGETKRRRMGKAARAWVVERYSHERVLGLAVDFYRGLLEDRAG